MAKKSPSQKPIRVGVIGVGRGQSFAAAATRDIGMELVALCGHSQAQLDEAGKKYNVTTYTDYDKFLQHDMDAVVLANYFHQHASFAIKALSAGLHVMSETSSNGTLADGVALCRAVEKSKKTYMLAENYPYTKFNQEMRRVYQSGEIGTVMYAEGEYNHPMAPADVASLSPGDNHWRRHIPSTYYCTHALAPLVYITGAMPRSVAAFSIPHPKFSVKNPPPGGDPGSAMLIQNDNGSVFRIMGLVMPGHSNYYRVHGSTGAMELTRGPGYFGPGQIRVWHEEWNTNSGQYPTDRVYTPDWPEHGELANKAGHGGGDFWTNFHFANAIRSGKPPLLDVYKGVSMSSIGILAWRSAVNGGTSQHVPDFSKESDRKIYEHDHWSPWPDGTGDGTAPSSILKPCK
jgi:predicted dehydrogenase